MRTSTPTRAANTPRKRGRTSGQAVESKVSMDSKGRCKDNIWIDRFIKFYNYKRPHQSIDELLPCMRYGLTA